MIHQHGKRENGKTGKRRPEALKIRHTRFPYRGKTRENDKKPGAHNELPSVDSILLLCQGKYGFSVSLVLTLFLLRRRAGRGLPTVDTERLISRCGRGVYVVAGRAIEQIHPATTLLNKPCSAASSLVNTRL